MIKYKAPCYMRFNCPDASLGLARPFLSPGTKEEQEKFSGLNFII
jgi:hypothetical protein